ncbi:Squalene--hopene cyclase [Enhygromyxa salina]|uniref:Squalene--hopene cyclase n=1 Tax=Enhygromyxa salina TaxID=215803 RepID=A0A0C2CLX9_9BACT|nr:prenyltransferase/squalene oxidase repeat-containing protein [Enhygromyxa salina]KIG12211.1 Squalene--hopene cyclase [Enhygromyxa salina]
MTPPAPNIDPLTTPLERERVLAAYQRACAALEAAQQPNGAWAGEVVWNPMLICQYVICSHIVGREIPEPRKQRIRLSLELQRKRDGGWGMHPDVPPAPGDHDHHPNHDRDPAGLAGAHDSWMFHTVLGYVALRLLGADPNEPLLQDVRAWIHAHGGPYGVPTWGRAWLALLGLYPWSELQPLLPELWLLGDDSPMHPRRLYCHMRLIYLGLSYLYGARTQADASPLVEAIRGELYPEGWDVSRFRATRDQIASTDLYEPIGQSLEWLFAGARALSRAIPAVVRRRALARAWEHIEFEFASTNWVCLSPVNGMLFCLAMWSRDRRDPRLAQALQGLEYWMWEDDSEGLRICGARSDIWDTSFALQALCEGPQIDEAARAVDRASAWLPRAQLRADILGGREHYRESARGGWGFANEHHPWPVSDCTAEALEALLHAEHRGWDHAAARLDLSDKLAAVEFVLLRQNDDGGFGSYEPRRGSMLLARFNPAEMYGNCMLEYSYTECTASCVRGLAVALEALGANMPSELRARVQAGVDAGVQFLLGSQASNGAWPGFWGVNYTYGTFFSVAGLLAAGLDGEHVAVRRAVRHLISAQRDDGGWGERYEGVLESRERPLDADQPSRIVQTAWALLTLQQAAPERGREAIERGLRFLLDQQQPDGTWPHDAAVGVFFNTAVLDYRLYKLVFPTWALSRWLSR